MDGDHLYLGGRLLTVRVWQEAVGSPERRLEWRGQVCDVVAGTQWHICGWPALVALLHTLAAERAQTVAPPPAPH